METVVAGGIGAVEAAVGAKAGPAGISAAVYVEGAGLAAGFFGGMVGIPSEIRDPLLLGSLALAGKRVTQAAMSGKLLQGPRAWGGQGGDGDSYPALVASGGDSFGGGARPYSGARMLPGRGGGFSLYPVTQEAPGVAG